MINAYEVQIPVWHFFYIVGIECEHFLYNISIDVHM